MDRESASASLIGLEEVNGFEIVKKQICVRCICVHVDPSHCGGLCFR